MAENDGVILMIIFSCFFLVMGISFFIMFNQYHKKLRERQKEALNNLIIGQDNERERIARDLHDQMGAELASIIFVVDEIKSLDPHDKEVKKEAKKKLKDATEVIRQISHDLMPITLSKYGLIESLYEFEQKNMSSFKIEIVSNCKNEKINPTIESHLYKIFNELITNTKKHSNASIVKLSLEIDKTANLFVFDYSDNGTLNADNKKNSDGIGIKNISTRVTLLNGAFKIDQQNGFRTTIYIPIIS